MSILLKTENWFILFAKWINVLKGFGTECAPYIPKDRLFNKMLIITNIDDTMTQ